jgi:branched-chain amino acid transport system substrate-binding protein
VAQRTGVNPYAVVAKYVYGSGYKAHLYVKAKRSLSPITIGWVNLDGGPLGRPWLTRIAHATVAMIDDQLGGVDGHPVVLSDCLIAGSEEEGQACAQKFLNSSQIAVIAGGTYPVGASSFTQTLAGQKPALAVALSPSQITAKNTFAFTGGSLSLATMFRYLAAQHVKSMAYVAQRDPSLAGVLRLISGLAAQAGITLKVTQYDPAATDFTATIAAADLNSVDAIFMSEPGPAVCAPLARALATAGVTKPIYSADTCLSLPAKQALGDYPKWRYVFTAGPSPLAPYAPGSDVAAFLATLHRYGRNPADPMQQFATGPFGQILTIIKLMAQAGPNNITPANMNRSLSSYTGGVLTGPPSERFGQSPYPSVGSQAVELYRYLGENKLISLTGGWFS